MIDRFLGIRQDDKRKRRLFAMPEVLRPTKDETLSRFGDHPGQERGLET